MVGDGSAWVAIVHGRGPDLNLPGPARGSANDQHDDDNEEDEDEKTTADVDTGCKQHAV